VELGWEGLEALALDDFIEAAGVRHPQLADDFALKGAVRLAELAVQPHEEERVAYPHDGGDHVGPADNEVQPFLDDGVHQISEERAAVRAKTRHRPGTIEEQGLWDNTALLGVHGLAAFEDLQERAAAQLLQ
jgi:hypothetical protein